MYCTYLCPPFVVLFTQHPLILASSIVTAHLPNSDHRLQALFGFAQFPTSVSSVPGSRLGSHVAFGCHSAVVPICVCSSALL